MMELNVTDRSRLSDPCNGRPYAAGFLRYGRAILVLVLAALLGGRGSAAAADTELAGKVLGLTGSRTKIVWNRGYRDSGGTLMGFDTQDGQERVIVPAPEVCHVPWFTQDGRRIVYSGPAESRSAYVVDWDGKNRRCILQGRHFFVLGVWRDPATGVEWVYASDATSKEADEELAARGEAVKTHTGLSVRRFRLDKPTVWEPVWDKAIQGVRTTISADGRYLVGEFPWPNCGLADIAAGSWKMIGQGCNANLAPDGSGFFFNLIGDHRNLNMYNKDGARVGGNIPVNTIPGNEKDPARAVWRPRWSNHVRFFTLQSADLGKDADISIGEFDESFTSVKSWVRITDTPDYDGNSQAWIEPMAGTEGQKTGLAKELTDLVGGRQVKVAWVRDGRDEGSLMGFDTEEGRERVIVPAPVRCTDPFFSPDGTRLFFSSPRDDQTAYMVDWTGKNLRKLLKGRHYRVNGVWVDPATGVEWLYVSDANSNEADAELVASGREQLKGKGLSVYRYKLNDLSVRELVWDKAPIGGRAGIAADGLRMMGEVNWPNCGVLTVPNGEYRIIGNGCNANLAPDGSGLFFNLIGDHRTMTMYDVAGTLKAKIAINTMPGIKDPERKVWRPRWSNEARLFSVQSADLGPDGDIWVGAFNETFTGVQSWVRVTDAADNEGCSQVWVKPEKGGTPKGGGAAVVNPPADEGVAGTGSWIGNREGLVFLWRNADRIKNPAMALNPKGEPITAYAPIVRGGALYGANYEMRLRGGSFVAHGVGEWLSAAVTKGGMLTFEAYVKPPAVSMTGEVGRIVSYAGAGGTMFAVGQKGNTLMIGRRAANMAVDKTGWVALMTLPDAKPFHLVVSCDAKQITVYRDGQEAGRVPARMVAAVWQPGQLVFGSNWEGRESWGGRLEGIAIYNRTLTAEEAAANAKGYAQIVGARKPVEQLRVKATLVARSESKTNIEPYFRAMALFEYKVNKVISGDYKGQKLYVSTWTVMNRKLLPDATRALQQEYELVVEPFMSHPELEPELQADTLDRDFEIPVYYEVEE